MLDKMPPQNKQAEEAVIGSILLGGYTTLSESQEVITITDFHHPETQKFWEVINQMAAKKQPIDLVSLKSNYPEVDLQYVFKLQNVVPTPGNIRYYAEEVKRKSLARQRIQQCFEEVRRLYEEDEPAEIISQSLVNGSALLSGVKKREIIHVKDRTFGVLDELEKRKDTNGVIGVPTGFVDLDRKIGGLGKGRLILLAARPAMGKTTFALNVAKHAAINLKIPTLFVSLEMTNEQLIEKMIAEDAGIKSSLLQNTTMLGDKEWTGITRSAAKLSDSELYLDDSNRIKASDLAVRLRRFKSLHPLGLVIIDYIQIMGPEKSGDRNREVSDTSGILQGLAKELDVPILALSQLSRDVERREDKIPKLADLRDSGTLEQDAAQVMFLYRRDYYHPEEGESDPSLSNLIIAKNRFGPQGMVDFCFFKALSKFTLKA